MTPRERPTETKRYEEAVAAMRGGYASQRELVAYYNDPMEVRAYLQMVVDEVASAAPRVRAPRGIAPGRYVDAVLSLSPTWTRVDPYLRRDARARFYRAVATALEATPGSHLYTRPDT